MSDEPVETDKLEMAICTLIADGNRIHRAPIDMAIEIVNLLDHTRLRECFACGVELEPLVLQPEGFRLCFDCVTAFDEDPEDRARWVTVWLSPDHLRDNEAV